ncbi:hypothetical protein QBC46DRAFT_251088 [Diplogelasinospora grovesii]|uniref:Zn(2)-C6 fungal-type domain-containing protein n=1 Tax=Diplogelasinospora grovesii TaxID=303347 RepID=A0AAN6NFN1_9PEZI|nr:hypothetical protein QBC46DRAFT_251088 [Diplogelasinospora grovesii]
MQALDYPRDVSCTSLGQRRGISDLARIALDLNWARADSESAARSGSYPSPPMSGSPPLPSKATQEAAERSQGTYQATTTQQDVYRGIQTTQGDDRLHPRTSLPPRPYPTEAPPENRMPFAFSNNRSLHASLSYSQQHAPQGVPQQQHQHQHQQQQQQSYLQVPRHGVGTAGPLPVPPVSYPAAAAASHHAIQEPLHHHGSPKNPRKTKGHVASACVPCKRAHLRCDAQRPCSRCLSNGKEESCVDVQHKKRGRPRLRDDRESQYSIARFGTAPDPIRRPISLYGAGSSMGMAYDDTFRRTQSYRVLKSQPAEPIAPRFPERGSTSDANIFPAPPLLITTRTPEPAAFLTIDLEFLKDSNTFRDAIGRPSLKGLKLIDLLVTGDRDKASSFQQQMHDAQRRRDPTYLPPIFGKQGQEKVMQTLGFSSEELSRYSLEWQDFFTFVMQDGHRTQLPIRMGLAKQDSIYFVVAVLNLPPRSFQYPTPSPNLRDITYSYQPMHQTYSQPTPVSATFDPRQSRLGDNASYGPRQVAPQPPQPPSGGPPHMMAGLSPGLPPSYAASPSRPDYPVGPSTYQIPRSHQPQLHPASRPPEAPGYQLPPIRNQQQGGGPSQQQELPYQTRDDRSRVDIGGLLDRPDPSKKAPQQ